MSSVLLNDLAGIVVDNLDGDGEFYSQEFLGEHVLDLLLDRGYLHQCDECRDRTGMSVLYLADDCCPNEDDHTCGCGECDCSRCYPDGCPHCEEEEADKEVEEAWGI